MVLVRKRKLKQRGRGTDEGTDRGTDEGTERGIRKGTGSGPGRDIFIQCPPSPSKWFQRYPKSYQKSCKTAQKFYSP